MSEKIYIYTWEALREALLTPNFKVEDSVGHEWRYRSGHLEWYRPDENRWFRYGTPSQQPNEIWYPFTATDLTVKTESDPPEPVVLKQPKRFPNLLNATSAERKEMPMHTGCIMYFPDGLAGVARVSFLSNAKHNPGQPLFWSYGKSADHSDAEIRHSTNKDGLDPEDDIPEVFKKAWRALADAQEYAEKQDHTLHAFRQAQRDRQAKGE